MQSDHHKTESAATPPGQGPRRPGAPAESLPPRALIEPNFQLPIQPIAKLVADLDFPKSALGLHVDIGGYPGVVVEIVRHSIRVRSSEGTTMSYNVNVLRKLYGPPPPAETAEPEPVPTPPAAAAPTVKREVITNPNFDAPLKPIEAFVERPDYPKCVLGELLDLRGYTGVVVEIVNGSLKVRSREGATRSYNAAGLRRLYGKAQAAKP